MSRARAVRFTVLTSAAFLAWAVPAAGQDAGLQIWAAPGLYGLEPSNCEPGKHAELDTAAVDLAFCPVLEGPARTAIGQRFATLLGQHFPGVKSDLRAGSGDGAGSEASLRSTLVASLRLSRALIWRVDKPVGTDAFLPLTLTLDLTDVASGEVVYSRTRSEIAEGSYASGNVEAALVAQLPGHIERVMTTLVTEAAAGWRPATQTATVIGTAGDAAIIDRGRIGGLRIGDDIGVGGRVTYAGPDYAVVAGTLEPLKPGQTVSRRSYAPVEMLARPAVLPVIASAPEGHAAPYLAQIFGDVLGARGRFSPVPVDPGFSFRRDMSFGEAGVTYKPRSYPDYIAGIRVVVLDPVTFASNVSGVTVELHEAHAFATLTDRTGRILATFHGIGRIKDDIAGGIGFPLGQRRDTAVRNALTDLAAKLDAFAPQPSFLALSGDDDALMVEDPNGVLPLGAQVPVLREESGVRDRKGPVLVPVGDVRIGQAVPGGMQVRDVGVEALRAKKGDVVAVEAAGRPLQSRRAIQQCERDGRMLDFDDRGQLEMPLWREAADLGFAGQVRGPVFDRALPARLALYKAAFDGWQGFEAATRRAAEICFTPVIAVAPKGDGYSLTAGYTLFRGGTKLTGSGLQADMTPTRLPPGSAPEAVAAMLQMDLAANVLPLAEKAAAALALED